MKTDKTIKKELQNLVNNTYKKPHTNKKWFNGFKILVKNGIVQIEKNGIKTKKGFLYDDGAKDYYGNDWNLGALGNLIIRWENENLKAV